MSKLLCTFMMFMMYNYCVTGVRTKHCLGKDRRLRPYNDLNEGCCNSGIYNKTVGADNFACCDGSYQVYNIRTHFCCENQLRRIQDENQSYECCQNELRDKKIGVCCENVYYEHGRKEECCGQLLNKRNQYFCCKDKSSISAKLHQKTSNQTCCGINSYKKKTNNKENGCCEDVPYSTITSDCSNGHVVPKGHAWCSVANTHYNQKNMLCCNTKLVRRQISNGQCCGDKEIDGFREECCNKISYGALHEQCCGNKIMGKKYKCCGGLRLDTSKYVCCGEEKITKITGYENKCCLVNGYIELYDVSKQTCTQKGVVTSFRSYRTSKPDMCGWNTYNKFVDLCCQGILVEKGIVHEMQCCGVQPYFTRNQTCLDDIMRNNSKSFNNPPSCSLFCKTVWLGNDMLKVKELKQKMFKEYAIRRIKKSLQGNVSWKIKNRRTKNRNRRRIRSKNNKIDMIKNKLTRNMNNLKQRRNANNIIKFPCDCKRFYGNNINNVMLLTKTNLPFKEMNGEYYLYKKRRKQKRSN
ncbi:galaxin-like isoform X2 [Mytilus edulis]|uniref:galaxin-like isoform X2 n=1 Tax=Mytilus edulis TaxID=6550 RepID=UPI0039EF728E